MSVIEFVAFLPLVLISGDFSNCVHPGWSIGISLMGRMAIMKDPALDTTTRCNGGRLLAQISRADSMIVAVKAGAIAEGFVLGLETAGVLGTGDAENLNGVLESALQQRLRFWLLER